MANSGAGRYSAILIAATLFVAADLTVLLLNFSISAHVDRVSAAINVAGRQRMLSQKITKALLSAELSMRITPGQIDADRRNELITAAALFSQTLHAFELGGPVPGPQGSAVEIEAVTTADAKRTLQEANRIWTPVRLQIDQALRSGEFVDIHRAAVTMLDQNEALLEQMNNLTSAIENRSLRTVRKLRMVQAGGFLFVLLDFFFILYKVFLRYKQLDAEQERMGRAHLAILEAARQGLMLVNPDYRITPGISRATSALLGLTIQPGQDIRALLQPLLPPAIRSQASDYLETIMREGIRQDLIDSLNPMKNVPIRVGTFDHRLAFAFRRVEQAGHLLHILVIIDRVD